MHRKPLIQIAHTALQYPDKSKVINLIQSVNLTLQEQSIITGSEIEGRRIAEIAEEQNLSEESIMRIKTRAMIKIAQYINIKTTLI